MSLLFWAWVLGPLGAILAVPLTIMCKALLLDIDPSTRWVDALLNSSVPQRATTPSDKNDEPDEPDEPDDPDPATPPEDGPDPTETR